MSDTPKNGNAKSKAIRILLVEDDPGCARLLEIVLSHCQYDLFEVRRAENLSAAIQTITQDGIDLVLLDLGLPDSQGIDTFVRMHAAAPSVPIIVLTGTDDEELATRTIQQGAQDFIVKGLRDNSSMVRTIRYALERYRSQQALADEHALLRSVVDNIPDQVYLKDTECRFVAINPETARFLGASSSDAIIGKCDFDFFPHELAAQFLTEDQAILHCEQPCVNREAAVTGSAGNMRWVLTTKVPLRDYTGNITGLLGINRDITERKQAEDEARKTLLWQEGVNRVQQSLLAPAPLADKLKMIADCIVRLFDADVCRIWLGRPCDRCEQSCTHADIREGPYVCHSRNQCLHLLANAGRNAYAGINSHLRVPFACYRIGQIASSPDHKFLTNDVLTDPHMHNHQWARELGLASFAGYQIRIRDGETLGVLALFAKHPVLKTEDAILDQLSTTVAFVVEQAISEETLQTAQMKLIDTARLESVAQLAAGVAHEVKNPLAIALMGLEYLSSTVGATDEQTATVLSDTKEALLQADAIVRELMNFAVPAKLEIERHDLNTVVAHSLYLVRHDARKHDVALRMDFGQDLPHLHFDRVKIEQALVNLCMNAIEAMPTGGTLLIKTRANQLDTGVTVSTVEVEDTGTGIASGDLARLFDPFFTKNQVGKGTGLGLTVAKRIIELHGGTIRIDNRPEGGARATITLQTKEDKP